MATGPTALADWVVVLPVILCLVGGAGLLVLRRHVGVQGWLCLAVLAAVLLCDGVLVQRIAAQGPLAMTMGHWLPPFGISFTADMMGAGFAALAAFATACVVLFTLEQRPSETVVRGGLYPLILVLLAGVSGAVLTGDLFNLYVWFEVMLIASFGLIVLGGQPLQLDAAVKYGVLNFLATTLFLAALGLLYGTIGTLNMADIVGAARKADPMLLAAIAGLMALAFAIKAAVFPVNAWLPAAYHAPPAAISALMGGLLTKVGVYALVRVLVQLLPVARDILTPAITAAAVATMILGPLCAFAETNPRRAVGFLLIGGIGVGLIGLVVPAALPGAIAYVAVSILVMTALYLAITSPHSRHCFVLILAAAGLPPFGTFWPKLMLLQALIAQSDAWPLVPILLLSSLLTLLAGARLWSALFWRPRAEPPRDGAAGGALLLLGGTIVMLSLWPSALIGPSILAGRDVLDPARYIAATGLAP